MNYSTKITLKINAMAIVIASLIIGFTGCSKDDSVNLGNVTLTTDATLGDILVDGKGKTLYFYTKDVSGQSACTGDCLNFWPAYYASDIKPGTGVDASDFATITRTDGKKQTTYKGRPLYYYVNDATAGATTGEGVDGIWFVAKPSYTVMLANNPTLGNVLVDAQGHTLYFFTKDSKTVNSCNCPTHWPAFNAGDVSTVSTLNASDFGSIGDGATKQTTYKGWPLYLYAPANDGVLETPGLTSGDNFGSGAWYVAKPDYSVMIVSAQLMDGSATPVNYTDVVNTYATGTGSTKYFVDAYGRTLYLHTTDTKNTNKFSSADATHNAIWPMYSVGATIGALPSSLTASDFSVVTFTATGTAQLVYKGYPLYYFGSDGTTRNGSNKGFAAGGIGTNWRIVNTDVVGL